MYRYKCIKFGSCTSRAPFLLFFKDNMRTKTIDNTVVMVILLYFRYFFHFLLLTADSHTAKETMIEISIMLEI